MVQVLFTISLLADIPPLGATRGNPGHGTKIMIGKWKKVQRWYF